MRIQCVLCDEIVEIDEDSLKAKRLRNRQIQIYLCETCDERISVKTIQRHETGKFRLYKEKRQKSKLI